MKRNEIMFSHPVPVPAVCSREAVWQCEAGSVSGEIVPPPPRSFLAAEAVSPWEMTVAVLRFVR